MWALQSKALWSLFLLLERHQDFCMLECRKYSISLSKNPQLLPFLLICAESRNKQLSLDEFFTVLWDGHFTAAIHPFPHHWPK